MSGCDDLKQWLVGRGFKCAADSLRSVGNECDWYAYKRTSRPSRECECNDGKPMQIVVKPHAYTNDGKTHESVTVEVTGEANAIWFNQSAYSLSPQIVMSRFDDIERMLIDAWNALLPIYQPEQT